MAGINKVLLLGNVGKDPEIRALENGRKVAKFPLATNEPFKDRNGNLQDRTEWHNIIFWGPIADTIEKYVKKGSQLFIEGRLTTRSYDSKEGVKKYITEIEGSNMTMLGKPGGNESGGTYTKNSAQDNDTPAAIKSDVQSDDDLPF